MFISRTEPNVEVLSSLLLDSSDSSGLRPGREAPELGGETLEMFSVLFVFFWLSQSVLLAGADPQSYLVVVVTQCSVVELQWCPASP